MSDQQNMDNSADSEADTASGGPAEPRDGDDQAVGDATGDAGAPSRPESTDADGTPVDNPAG
ncbi:MAG TPA: hypothetical protein VNR36_14365 [Pseudolysinimonas sp.]|nr:hypothetical protein [Pseudolysinimonas sp.]